MKSKEYPKFSGFRKSPKCPQGILESSKGPKLLTKSDIKRLNFVSHMPGYLCDLQKKYKSPECLGNFPKSQILFVFLDFLLCFREFVEFTK